MEIDQEAHADVQQPQMREQLCIINRVQRLFAFKFNYDPGFDHQISSETAVELDAIVDNRDRLLSLNSLAKSQEFVSKACFVRGFEQAGPKPAMNCYCGSDDFITKIARHGRILVVRSLGCSMKIAQQFHFGNFSFSSKEKQLPQRTQSAQRSISKDKNALCFAPVLLRFVFVSGLLFSCISLRTLRPWRLNAFDLSRTEGAARQVACRKSHRSSDRDVPGPRHLFELPSQTDLRQKAQ